MVNVRCSHVLLLAKGAYIQGHFFLVTAIHSAVEPSVREHDAATLLLLSTCSNPKEMVASSFVSCEKDNQHEFLLLPSLLRARETEECVAVMRMQQQSVRLSSFFEIS